ncbi:MAG: tRNA (N(6)-L-threonylcarbamoyladenosine(37)-C(2))-methylthiotransferase MtaB [Clostridiales bacterium]|nr:tRNA (N(6)-L-threonylcarbamoyladenosine(37)-C(2))-methylthiotransferase MtaB [Clostridiales bacterium]
MRKADPFHRKAALHNLGCKVNAYETEAMQQLLEAAGYEIVPFTQEADVYIVNTCSVTNMADKKSRQMLHRARKQNPDAVVVAAGCYVQSASEPLKKDLSVDIIIGNNRKRELVTTLDAYFARKKDAQEITTGETDQKYGIENPERPQECVADIVDIGKTGEYEALSVRKLEDHTRAFIKIQDGCNQFCSYCIIPYVRGRVRSRRPEEVEAEVRTLVKEGFREIVLTGIHLSSYGVDFADGEDAAEKTGLLELILRLHPIEGLERIRLGSLEPRIITPDFVETLAGLEKFCPHFHLSLQSGCDETLKRMNRHYTTAEYQEKCERIREKFVHPAITTDVIVGFPGETEEEFAKTREFLQKIRFYEMHIFKYSRRAGTRADRMENQIPESVKTARSDVLLRLEREMSGAFRRDYLNQTIEVLLEERVTINGDDYMLGHTREYVKAAVPYQPDLKNALILGRAAGMLNPETIFLDSFAKVE